jgi:iron complex transport system ATP-binding protein
MSDLVAFRNVSVSYDGAIDVLTDVDIDVASGQRWVIIGPNGSGKSTMVQLLTGFLHPSRGDYSLVGKRLGQGVDWRVHRTQIGFVSAALAKMMRPQVESVDVVMTALYGALEPWWHEYSDADRTRAYDLLDVAGYGYLATREFGVLSEGEKQQVLLARSLMRPPKLLVLDEPAAGLDLGNRERLIRRLASVAQGPVDGTDGVAGVVLVTHHVEEIAPGFTHALLLRAGRVVASGSIDSVLTDANLTATFDLDITLSRDSADGRYSAKVRL